MASSSSNIDFSWIPSIEEIRETIAATDFGCRYLALHEGGQNQVQVQIAADDMQASLQATLAMQQLQEQQEEQEQQQEEERKQQIHEKLMIGMIDVPSSVSLKDYIEMEAATMGRPKHVEEGCRCKRCKAIEQAVIDQESGVIHQTPRPPDYPPSKANYQAEKERVIAETLATAKPKTKMRIRGTAGMSESQQLAWQGRVSSNLDH